MQNSSWRVAIFANKIYTLQENIHMKRVIIVLY